MNGVQLENLWEEVLSLSDFERSRVLCRLFGYYEVQIENITFFAKMKESIDMVKEK